MQLHKELPTCPIVQRPRFTNLLRSIAVTFRCYGEIRPQIETRPAASEDQLFSLSLGRP